MIRGEQAYDGMPEYEWGRLERHLVDPPRKWMDMLHRLSSDPSILGAGGHLLYVGEGKAG